MNRVKILVVSLILLVAGGSIQAQSFGKRLGKAIENAAKNTTVRKAEQKTDEAVNKGIDKVTNPDTYKDKDKDGASTGSASGKQSAAGTADEPAEPTPQQGVKATEMAWNKFDFVSGDEIIFDDNQAGEQLGEFPSQWDMLSGNCEIAKMDDEQAIALFNSSGITPLMKNPKDYLPEMFTIELDFYIFTKEQTKSGSGIYNFLIKDGNKDIFKMDFWNDYTYGRINASVVSIGGGEARRISETPEMKPGWHRLSLSFNQTLSDARSKAAVDKLVELGVAKDRLQSAGKGQNSPIADNGTDEGRAKNRRVEFVSIRN